MTLAASGARRRGADFTLPAATETAPYGPITLCTIPPTPGGNYNVIHPSVHDFGTEWNGYRWWMANTPYPVEGDENPWIYASNDMETWVIPDGLTNPIDPWPGIGKYNSDTELVVDDEGNLVCIYREYDGGDHIRARSSSNGVTWSDEVALFSPPSLWGSMGTSPAAIRWGPGDFRMFVYGSSQTVQLRAPHPLGPWTVYGSSSMSPSYHGDVMRYSGDVLLVANSGGTGGAYCGHSLDAGATWMMPATPTITGGVIGNAYRPTLAPSPKPGWIDVWIGAPYGEGGETRTAYTRVPLSAFGLG